MFTTFTPTVLLVFLVQLPAKPQAPTIKFLSATKDGILTFEITNPNAEAMPCFGYRPDSFSPRLKDGTIAPLYMVKVHRRKGWKEYDSCGCAYGFGRLSVPGKGKATFEVDLLGDSWDKLRVGLIWCRTADYKEPAVAWSALITKHDLAPKKP